METNEREQKRTVFLDSSLWFAKAVTQCTRDASIETRTNFVMLVKNSDVEAVKKLDEMTEEQLYQELKRMNILSMAVGPNFYWGCDANAWVLTLYFEISGIPKDYTILKTGQIIFDETEYGNQGILRYAQACKQKLSSWARIRPPEFSNMSIDLAANKDWLEKNLLR